LTPNILLKTQKLIKDSNPAILVIREEIIKDDMSRR